ncbi:hypothetical protein [Microbacterium candidum]|uniref:Uncharacterized protein n=1 Tax=Microbacterium candidum TaxID=3041922 RepID=A0ABT7N095_9MICO|nr:hypothetical protein [Microbacterium sp. ASV49]MDL9980122.1 hypothetical protein [Microbacterium sp. ASV49]
MSIEYEASYRHGRQRTADLVREAELIRRADAWPEGVVVKPPKAVPFWVWFHRAGPRADRFRAASVA